MTGDSATRVLLVEDEPADARIVRTLLKSVRHERFEVTSLDRLSLALDHVRAFPCDVALLDLSLPDSFGVDTIRTFRSAVPDLPTVVLTGLDDREVGLLALREGCQDYLFKGNVDGETMARTIAYAIQRKRLETELIQAREKIQDAYEEMERRVVERTSQLRRVAVEATMAEERERQAIARDLHDDLGQMLHVAKIKLGQLAKPLQKSARDTLLEDMSELLSDASRMVRSLTSQLSPPTLHELGLAQAITWLADEMGRSYGLKILVSTGGTPALPIPSAHSAILFRAVRELLINVSKHAGTNEAEVAMRTTGDRLLLRVSDNGGGMADWRASLAAGKGFGLASIRERITFLGGSMDVRASPGNGTVVSLELPLDGPAEHA